MRLVLLSPHFSQGHKDLRLDDSPTVQGMLRGYEDNFLVYHPTGRVYQGK